MIRLDQLIDAFRQPRQWLNNETLRQISGVGRSVGRVSCFRHKNNLCKEAMPYSRARSTHLLARLLDPHAGTVAATRSLRRRTNRRYSFLSCIRIQRPWLHRQISRPSRGDGRLRIRDAAPETEEESVVDASPRDVHVREMSLIHDTCNP